MRDLPGKAEQRREMGGEMEENVGVWELVS